MSQGVMVIMQGFPKVEALSLEAKFDSESATELLREKLKDGYLKWNKENYFLSCFQKC